VASNGLEALEKIRKVSKTDGTSSGQPFDCVIMDLEMPGTYFGNMEIKLTNSNGWPNSGETCPRGRKSRIISKQPGHSPKYVHSHYQPNEADPQLETPAKAR